MCTDTLRIAKALHRPEVLHDELLVATDDHFLPSARCYAPQNYRLYKTPFHRFCQFPLRIVGQCAQPKCQV